MPAVVLALAHDVDRQRSKGVGHPVIVFLVEDVGYEGKERVPGIQPVQTVRGTYLIEGDRVQVRCLKPPPGVGGRKGVVVLLEVYVMGVPARKSAGGGAVHLGHHPYPGFLRDESGQQAGASGRQAIPAPCDQCAVVDRSRPVNGVGRRVDEAQRRIVQSRFPSCSINHLDIGESSR